MSGETIETKKLILAILLLGVTVSTVWEVGDPWTSGGFLTEHV